MKKTLYFLVGIMFFYLNGFFLMKPSRALIELEDIRGVLVFLAMLVVNIVILALFDFRILFLPIFRIRTITGVLVGHFWTQ